MFGFCNNILANLCKSVYCGL